MPTWKSNWEQQLCPCSLLISISMDGAACIQMPRIPVHTMHANPALGAGVLPYKKEAIQGHVHFVHKSYSKRFPTLHWFWSTSLNQLHKVCNKAKQRRGVHKAGAPALFCSDFTMFPPPAAKLVHVLKISRTRNPSSSITRLFFLLFIQFGMDGSRIYKDSPTLK